KMYTPRLTGLGLCGCCSVLSADDHWHQSFRSFCQPATLSRLAKAAPGTWKIPTSLMVPSVRSSLLPAVPPTPVAAAAAAAAAVAAVAVPPVSANAAFEDADGSGSPNAFILAIVPATPLLLATCVVPPSAPVASRLRP
ncbi:hypothetical protein Vretimale_12180, partial [Volvox reticuliferus]